MNSSIRAAAIVLALSLNASAETWPEFRGPTGQGLSTAKNVPVRWTSEEHVAWKQPIPGTGWSSPVLVDGRIYLTSAVPSSDGEAGSVSLRALCIDASSGRILWNEEAIHGSAADAKITHQKNTAASPTAIVAGNRVFVHFGHMGTAAFDLSGKLVWKQTDIKYSPMHGNGGSAALVGDMLVYSGDGLEDPFVAAINQRDGQTRWKTPREKVKAQTFSFSTPLVIKVNGVEQIISPASGFVGAYDPRDGHEIWRVRYGDGFSVIPRPVFAQGLVFVCSGYGKAVLLAIDPVGAAGDATDKHVRWQTDRGAPFTPSPLVVGDELYVVADSGVATCFDARTGKQNWTQRLGGAFSASPVFADGNVFFLNEEGVSSVVKSGPKYELVATNDLGERTLASPAPSDGTLFIRTESNLYRIGN